MTGAEIMRNSGARFIARLFKTFGARRKKKSPRKTYFSEIVRDIV